MYLQGTNHWNNFDNLSLKTYIKIGMKYPIAKIIAKTRIAHIPQSILFAITWALRASRPPGREGGVVVESLMIITDFKFNFSDLLQVIVPVEKTRFLG